MQKTLIIGVDPLCKHWQAYTDLTSGFLFLIFLILNFNFWFFELNINI